MLTVSFSQIFFRAGEGDCGFASLLSRFRGGRTSAAVDLLSMRLFCRSSKINMKGAFKRKSYAKEVYFKYFNTVGSYIDASLGVFARLLLGQ